MKGLELLHLRLPRALQLRESVQSTLGPPPPAGEDLHQLLRHRGDQLEAGLLLHLEMRALQGHHRLIRVRNLDLEHLRHLQTQGNSRSKLGQRYILLDENEHRLVLRSPTPDPRLLHDHQKP